LKERCWGGEDGGKNWGESRRVVVWWLVYSWWAG